MQLETRLDGLDLMHLVTMLHATHLGGNLILSVCVIIIVVIIINVINFIFRMAACKFMAMAACKACLQRHVPCSDI